MLLGLELRLEGTDPLDRRAQPRVRELAGLDKLERRPSEVAVRTADLALCMHLAGAFLGLRRRLPGCDLRLVEQAHLSPSLAWMSLLRRANDPTPARLRPVRRARRPGAILW